MTNPFDYDDPAIQAGRRKTIRDVAAAEIAAFDAFERWARGRWRAFLGWLARRAQRWGAAWAAWRRWLALAARPKDAGVTAEIASVHTFLAATPVSPFRVLSIGALAALAASLVWGAVGWFVRVPLLKAEAADPGEGPACVRDNDDKHKFIGPGGVGQAYLHGVEMAAHKGRILIMERHIYGRAGVAQLFGRGDNRLSAAYMVTYGLAQGGVQHSGAMLQLSPFAHHGCLTVAMDICRGNV